MIGLLALFDLLLIRYEYNLQKSQSDHAQLAVACYCTLDSGSDWTAKLTWNSGQCNTRVFCL